MSQWRLCQNNMSRKLYRVPLDFNWPMKQVWKGYICPYDSQPCIACDRTGLNKETKALQDTWYSFNDQEWVWVSNDRKYNKKAWSENIDADDVQALLDADRLWDFTHTFVSGQGWQPKNPTYIPTPEEINHRARTGHVHDSYNAWICVKAKAKRLGIYGMCEFCNGDGVIWQSPEIKKLNNKWKKIHPPKGKGFQLWEDCSEGSPVSPVFKSLEDLCTWAEDNATTFGTFKASKMEWMAMLKDDFVHHAQGNAIFI